LARTDLRIFAAHVFEMTSVNLDSSPRKTRTSSTTQCTQFQNFSTPYSVSEVVMFRTAPFHDIVVQGKNCCLCPIDMGHLDQATMKWLKLC
jgi:hypothetical protein